MQYLSGICSNTRYKSGELQVKLLSSCGCLMIMWNVKSAPHSPRNRYKGEIRNDHQGSPHRQDSSMQHRYCFSIENECGPDADNQNVAFYSLFMYDLRQSKQRIPSMARKAILKELIETEEDTDTEGAVRYSQALPVSEQVILVTSLMDSSSPEELIKGDIRSLTVDSLQLLTYNLLRGKVKDVLRDAQSFPQT